MTQWFLDFDETLVVGPVTWALETVLPAMIRENALSFDQTQLDAAILRGQEHAASGMGDMAILDVLFSEMGWPSHLQKKLLTDVFDNYVPVMFDDTLPFLKQVGSIYVLSNNSRSPEIAAQLGMTPYISRFFTPKLCNVKRGKPERDLWDFVCATHDVSDVVLVGDDPWSDGAFTDTCGIDFIMLDRLDRFPHLTQYKRISSLASIPGASAVSAPE